MPATKNQLRRVDILDGLLNRGHRRWTLNELLEELNEKLEADGCAIDRRTLFRDLNYMIDDLRAPIHRPEKGDRHFYYEYRFSVKTPVLDDDEMGVLFQARDFLQQVDGFHLRKELDDAIARLGNNDYSGRVGGLPAVMFEAHTSCSGHEHFDDLYHAIVGRTPLRLAYQPYNAREPVEKVVHPYLLKEWRNRWFLFGREEGQDRISIYAIDRIRGIRNSGEQYRPNNLFDPETYFDHLIGVSAAGGDMPQRIEIMVFPPSAPYIRSKPIHRNQFVIREYKDGRMLIGLDLIVNYELKSTLLGYGDGLEVKKPESLKSQMKEMIGKMSTYY